MVDSLVSTLANIFGKSRVHLEHAPHTSAREMARAMRRPLSLISQNLCGVFCKPFANFHGKPML